MANFKSTHAQLKLKFNHTDLTHRFEFQAIILAETARSYSSNTDVGQMDLQ